MNRRFAPALVPVLGILAILVSSSRAEIPAPPRPGLPVEAEKPAGYIRYLTAEDATAPDAADRLQTAVARFEQGGTVIDLVSVVHLGDAAYFATLNERLAGYDFVLYEMVGGPAPRKDAASPDVEAGEMQAIRQVQKMAKAILGLEYQLDGIDYSAANFVHADVAWDEMGTLMAARNETLLSLVTRASALAEEGGIAGISSDPAAMEAMMKRMFQAVLTGDSAGLKRSLAPLLSESESVITRLEGEEGSVLIGERNRVVMEKLAELRAAKGAGRYAIFYGAGHMPDFEDRLLAAGFRKSEPVWLDAWSMPRNAAAPAVETTPAASLLRLLSENPEVMSGLQELGTLLEDLGGAIKSIEPVPAVP